MPFYSLQTVIENKNNKKSSKTIIPELLIIHKGFNIGLFQL